jgi:Fe(3+) dicitrate transport protein
MPQQNPRLARSTLCLALATAFAGTPHGTLAADPASERLAAANNGSARIAAPRVDVIGAEQNLPLLGGAASTVTADELRDSKVFTTAEALRKVPGVNVRDEEGFGLRPNIGIRGLNPTRSTKVTLLEDGIPVSYAPYGDNASYYHPAIDRFDRIEVLKGANALQFGPQTIGGVINYITPNPPRDFGGYVQGTVGNRDYFNGKVNLGGNGFLLDYTRKQGDGARQNMKHEIDDLNLKWVGQISDRQAITLRGNYYKEDSQLTYSGLTQAEFRNFGARYNPFRNDTFNAERFGASATHDFDFGNGAVLTTNLYYSYFTRDWVRQASNSQDTQCQASYTANTGRNFNADRLAGVSVNPGLCNSTQGRLRDYTTYGIEPRLLVANRLGEFQMGVKAHFEEQDRLQLNATASSFDPKSPNASGAIISPPAEDQVRKVDAYSGFVAQRFDLGPFAITPIVRYESIESRRSNRLNGASGSARVTETSPGIGATWNPNKDWTLFTSLYEGFAPPRVEDLIGGSGTVADVDPERSTNFEFGLRAKPAESVSLQAAYFRNDFKNLIAVGNIAGGSTPLSQGKALFEGLELAGRAELGAGFFGRLAYTWLPTAEQESPFFEVANRANTRGAAGNRLAYAPEHTATAGLGYRIGAFRGEVELQHVGDQFSDFNETRAASANGQIGQISSYTIVNANASYQLAPKGATLFITAKNLTDRTYIVDRTRGIQVGMPLLVQAGVRWDF